MTSIFVCLIFAKNKQTKNPWAIFRITQNCIYMYIYIYLNFFFFGPFIFGSFFVAAIEKKCFRILSNWASTLTVTQKQS